MHGCVLSMSVYVCAALAWWCAIAHNGLQEYTLSDVACRTNQTFFLLLHVCASLRLSAVGKAVHMRIHATLCTGSA